MKSPKAVSMYRDGPETQLPVDAAARMGLGVPAGLILLLGAGLWCAPTLAAQAPGLGQAAMPAMEAEPGDYVGSAACTTCHDQPAGQHGKLGVGCESCHGAGKAHVQGNGDKARIFNPANGTAKEVDAKCLKCHAGQLTGFDHSSHAMASLSCVSCHSIHGGSHPEHSLIAPQPALCFQCHSAVQPQFSLPSHHKVNEGVVKCTGCHNPHAAMQSMTSRNMASQNAACTKCHTDKAGPFAYEHAVVKAEGCTSCHSPHGSQNARLLNVSSVNALCSQCHSAANLAASAAGPVHSQIPKDVACTSCHTRIHGSNADRNLLK
jgi:DmsE family decaheme c-type cytochrome